MSNFFVQELVLYRHFMLIDSPIPFELVANPTNYRKDERGNVLNVDMSEITGRDICSRPAGAWRVDCWTLLPEKYHKQNPVFTMLIKYDKDLLGEGEVVDIRYSDIDIGEGVAGVNGQLVSIPAEDFRPVVNAIESASVSVSDKFDEQNIFLSGINAKIDSIESKVSDILTIARSRFYIDSERLILVPDESFRFYIDFPSLSRGNHVWFFRGGSLVQEINDDQCFVVCRGKTCYLDVGVSGTVLSDIDYIDIQGDVRFI